MQQHKCSTLQKRLVAKKQRQAAAYDLTAADHAATEIQRWWRGHAARRFRVQLVRRKDFEQRVVSMARHDCARWHWDAARDLVPDEVLEQVRIVPSAAMES
jgi:IQ calmodulin-binding motif